MSIENFKEIVRLVQESDRNGVLRKAQDCSGFSGEKLIGVLQRIAKYQNDVGEGCYLEVGTFQGLTLISVASVLVGLEALGIDNFSQFDPKGINKDIVHQRAHRKNIDNIRLINLDYEDALENLANYIGDSKIGLYFVDGPHDYRSQFVCLSLAKPFLSNHSVIVVDDCNYPHVRLANTDFLKANPDYKLVYEAYTKCHPGNMGKADEKEARAGWWNGVNIIVRDPGDVLSPMFPRTIRDRSLYENEHIVHSAKYGALAPEAVILLQSILSFRLFVALKQIYKISRKMRKTNQVFFGKYFSMNTYSEELAKENYNESLQ